MRIERERCEDLVSRSERGVLATVHASRGVDAVPACFAVDAPFLVVPVDRVKEKTSADLQRTRNLDDDPRAALLCDHWDPVDWSRLWWVRVTLVRVAGTPDQRSTLESLLRLKYRQYRDRQFAGLLVFRIREMTGWSAGSGDAGAP